MLRVKFRAWVVATMQYDDNVTGMVVGYVPGEHDKALAIIVCDTDKKMTTESVDCLTAIGWRKEIVIEDGK